ncbi:unnamed protein product [Cyclocybe aegerita]|uniref:PEBP-like protein n=1 Tax=Cyclocybe aegerita TaxID=1973307 RepID=A0A8S0W729_CYCAE|nr:unnamed protein product [Cyclocybe aegerita]
MRSLTLFVATLVSVFTSVAYAHWQDTNITEVKLAFEEAHIPEDVGLSFNPLVLLGVTYFSSKTGLIPVKAGAELSMNDTYSPPTFNIVGNPGVGPLVIFLIDPDAPWPQDPSRAQARHFMGGSYYWDPESGVLTEIFPPLNLYDHPRPAKGSARHRYVFYAFKQSVELSLQKTITATSSRLNFNLSDFARETNLGDPIGGTFMWISPDP